MTGVVPEDSWISADILQIVAFTVLRYKERQLQGRDPEGLLRIQVVCGRTHMLSFAVPLWLVVLIVSLSGITVGMLGGCTGLIGRYAKAQPGKHLGKLRAIVRADIILGLALAGAGAIARVAAHSDSIRLTAESLWFAGSLLVGVVAGTAGRLIHKWPVTRALLAAPLVSGVAFVCLTLDSVVGGDRASMFRQLGSAVSLLSCCAILFLAGRPRKARSNDGGGAEEH